MRGLYSFICRLIFFQFYLISPPSPQPIYTEHSTYMVENSVNESLNSLKCSSRTSHRLSSCWGSGKIFVGYTETIIFLRRWSTISYY